MSEALRLIYDARDAMAEHGFRQEPIACQAGCGHCCSHPITATLTEAQMIVESLHLRTLPLERRADLENEWASQCEEFAKNGWRKYRRPCSFLDNLSMCNVYKTRPFVCRIYNSKDVDDCKNNGCADVVSIPWDKMFARLAHIEHAMHRSGEATQESIAEANKRYFLPAAMLYVTCALYQAGIPDVFLHKPSEVQP